MDDRFWSKVDKNGPLHPVLGTRCWLWTAGLDRYGYGRYRQGAKTVGAHRVAYMESGAVLEGDVQVLHRCDKRSCCRPDHLYAGTNADNMADKVARGRQPRGEDAGPARLTAGQVEEIRRLYKSGEYTQEALAHVFGTTAPNISYIVRSKTWK